jgi:hypothetical protein
MRLAHDLALLACLFLLQTEARAQLNDMPSQAELDPILENADSKVEHFLATLAKYHAEASEIDGRRLEKDLHDFDQLRAMIQKAHSGRGEGGANLTRIFGILASLDDAAIEARVWSNLLTPGVCSQNKHSLLFALAVLQDADMLKEVSNQLFHPGFRMMDAADEIMSAMADAMSKGKPKAH